jgi:dTDP-4-amino-4,6-dideoxygalactose transaminase
MKFEELFREYIGTQYSVAVHSCTAALHLSLIASNVKAGDEVITSPMTFAATANAIIHTGATPVFADITVASLNIDPAEIKKRLTPSTKVILPVHFAGRACDMTSIMEIAKQANAIIINDAAHAIETEFCGKKIGCYGAMTAYSFYATKNIVTGEGGMVVTDDKEIADKIKIYALHGMSKDAWKRFSDSGFKHYEIIYPGFKYNMMDLQAAIGLRQMPKIESYSRRRKQIWDIYNEAFKRLPVTMPAAQEPNTRHAYHLYTLLLDLDHLTITRDQFLDLMFHENIGTGVHRNRFGYQRGDYPNTEFVADRTVSLPLSAKLTDEDVEDVVNAVTGILTSRTRS